MKKLLHLLARLYPAAWRERYGAELHAVLDDSQPRWTDIFDLLKGGAVMQLSRPVVLAGVFGIAGVLAAGAFALSRPQQFVSTALIRIRAQDPEAATDKLMDVTQAVFSRASLAAVVNQFALYPRERMKTPIEDVAHAMKRNIRVLPANNNQGGLAAFAVEFSYPDPKIAQDVTRHLVSRFIDENVRQAVKAGRPTRGLTLELLDPASFPKKPAVSQSAFITAAGLAGGIMLGLTIAAFRRRRRAAV